jgi:hypothetical protein
VKQTPAIHWLAVLLLLSGCAYEAKPEEVALEYGRALYAGDLERAYRLISADDRRVKGAEAFRRDGGAATGFALEMARQLASFMEAPDAETTISGERASVKIKVRLPDANAPELAALVADWDERRLNGLPQAERERLTRRLDQLHRSKQIPMLEGEETFELVREAPGWRVFLNWAGGVRVRFRAALRERISLQVTVSPEEALVSPGERVHVTLKATNRSTQEIVARVNHRIDPRVQADSLALLQCPLLIPVTLKPAQTEEFRSEYLLLKDVPADTKEFQVTYEFSPVK